MDRETKRGLSLIIGVLLAMNAFFIKRLVDKIDSIEQSVIRLSEQVSIMKATKPPYSCHLSGNHLQCFPQGGEND